MLPLDPHVRDRRQLRAGATLLSVAVGTMACSSNEASTDTTSGGTTAPTSTAGEASSETEAPDETGGDATGSTPATSTSGATSGEETGAAEVTYADIQAIWDEHCVDGCHEPGGVSVTWHDLSPGVSYGEIVGIESIEAIGMAKIEPGDLESSYLWHKLNGTQVGVGGGGLDMPAPREGMEATVLTQAQFDAIEAWISAGAPE